MLLLLGLVALLLAPTQASRKLGEAFHSRGEKLCPTACPAICLDPVSVAQALLLAISNSR